ncbi:hypothetical protein [Iodidimonas sp. SYSU 1G8]|uniref:hypothetical protein n=1 Tax=Iodidimonas sp. SYSU 1G8 TaxID=3133967 RepID=UPI0031FED1E8
MPNTPFYTPKAAKTQCSVVPRYQKLTEMGTDPIHLMNERAYSGDMSALIEFSYRGYRISCHRLHAWWCVVADEASGELLPSIISAHPSEAETTVSARAKAAVDVHCLLNGGQGDPSPGRAAKETA